MKLLLDTHIFIWWAHQPEKLSRTVLSALEDDANELFVSVASVWEMQIKVQLGRLKLSLPLKQLVESQQDTNDLRILPVALTHALALDASPTVLCVVSPPNQPPTSIAVLSGGETTQRTSSVRRRGHEVLRNHAVH